MIIVEFCGSPGCGKSTLCKKIQERYSGKGLKIINRYEIEASILPPMVKNNLLIIKIYHVFLRIICIKYVFFKKYSRFLYEFCKKSGTNLNNKWVKAIYQMDYYIHVLTKKKIDILLLDEGILQFITSVSHGNKLDPVFSSLVREIESIVYDCPSIIFQCELDIEENVRRIKNRGGDGRFDKIPPDILPKHLKIKTSNIKSVVGVLQLCSVSNIDVQDFDEAYNGIITELDNFLNLH